MISHGRWPVFMHVLQHGLNDVNVTFQEIMQYGKWEFHYNLPVQAGSADTRPMRLLRPHTEKCFMPSVTFYCHSHDISNDFCFELCFVNEE